MAELIDRDAAIRYLLHRATAAFRESSAFLAERKYIRVRDMATGVRDAADLLKDLPAVDAVEVVRCGKREFRYYAPDGSGHCRKKLGDWFTDDGFCSDGQRREEDHGKSN